jgi:hypothetical protein
MVNGLGPTSTNSSTLIELEHAVGTNTENRLNDIIVHPATKVGQTRIQNRKLAVDLENFVTSMRTVIECLRGAPDEPEYYFVAGLLSEYVRLLDAITELDPRDPEFLKDISILCANIAGLQEVFLLSFGARKPIELRGKSANVHKFSINSQNLMQSTE